MKEKFVDILKGETNTLSRTEEVVDLVLEDKSRMDELFNLYSQDDEWVRLRTNSALKRIWRADKQLIVPYLDEWIAKVSLLEQPSVNWTFAQMVEECSDLLNNDQRQRSIESIKNYILTSDDWIVLNCSMQTLSKFALSDTVLKKWLTLKLEALAKDNRKSVASRAKKNLNSLA